MTEQKEQKATALNYDLEKAFAPRVTATGKGETAEEIIRIARENGIPIREDSALMELLMNVDVMEEVPPEAFQLVAEVFAFIYEMNTKAKENQTESRID